MRSVSIIGIGETKMGRHADRSLSDLIKEAGEKAILDAGIEKERIQALYMGNFNGSYWSTQSHVGPLASEVLGLGTIPTLRTEGACATGSLAFRQGLIAIAAGIYDVVLIGGVEKMTHRPIESITTGLASAAHFDFEANAGATFPSLFAMVANRYAYEFGDVREVMALAAVQNHENGLLNPNAQMQKRITVEQVYNGFPVAHPLTVFDCSLTTDGSAFIVLAATEVAEKISKNRVVEVVGSGHAGNALTLVGKKNITTFDATLQAAKEAYAMANLKATDMNLAEVHDCFTITQIVNTEDLGFFKKGTGGKALKEGKTAIGGQIPINTSGGLKAKGHPIGATGLSQIYEVVTQIRGEAGQRQVKNAEIGLTHNLGGTAATCVVHILKGR